MKMLPGPDGLRSPASCTVTCVENGVVIPQERSKTTTSS